MKILLVNDYGGATGGAELQMLTLRRLLRSRGHDARLFASTAEVVEQSPILADYTCYGTTDRLQVLSQTLNISAYRALKKTLQDFQPDVVHVRMFLWQLSPLILPLLRPYPCLYQTAVYKAICPIGTNILPSGKACRLEAGTACLRQGCLTPQSWIWLMAQRSLWQQWQGVFDRTVALSYGMKQELEQSGISSVDVIYNGVPHRARRPPLNSPPTIGYAGRFSEEKGLETLFRAFAKVVESIPTAQLKMAGQGADESALRKLAEALNISERLTWLGHLSREDVEKAFDSVWVQVVPSLWAEPFGNVTTEAMMRGTAVVASAVGAQPEILGVEATATKGNEFAGAGKLVAPGDAVALSAALCPILQQKSVAERMGEVGHRRAAAHFSEAQCVERFLAVYKELAREPAAA